jgi:hypothetical protein
VTDAAKAAKSPTSGVQKIGLATLRRFGGAYSDFRDMKY